MPKLPPELEKLTAIANKIIAEKSESMGVYDEIEKMKVDLLVRGTAICEVTPDGIKRINPRDFKIELSEEE